MHNIHQVANAKTLLNSRSMLYLILAVEEGERRFLSHRVQAVCHDPAAAEGRVRSIAKPCPKPAQKLQLRWLGFKIITNV